jgi:hypothetical protein
MATFIKAGFWEKLCKPCKGYKGWLNLDEFVESKVSAPAYKVYTALLTQSGGDDPNTVQGNVNIKPGVTYTIENLEPGDNLIPYGAPNNEVGTSFVCNQDIFNWGNPLSQLSFNGGAPTATVLENTIGNIWFVYGSTGNYGIFSDGLFSTIDKCFILIPSLMSPSLPDVLIGQEVTYQDENLISLQTFGIEVGSIALSDNGLYNTPIEIRVYN